MFPNCAFLKPLLSTPKHQEFINIRYKILRDNLLITCYHSLIFFLLFYELSFKNILVSVLSLFRWSSVITLYTLLLWRSLLNAAFSPTQPCPPTTTKPQTQLLASIGKYLYIKFLNLNLSFQNGAIWLPLTFIIVNLHRRCNIAESYSFNFFQDRHVSNYHRYIYKI